MSQRTYQLTWHRQRKCWKKFYEGRRYYCPIKCRGKSDRDGYVRCLQWWSARQVELVRSKQQVSLSNAEVATEDICGGPVDPSVLQELSRLYGEPVSSEQQVSLSNAEVATEDINGGPVDLSKLCLLHFRSFLDQQSESVPSDRIEDLKELIKSYVRMLRQRVRQGTLATGSYEDEFTKLKTFLEFLDDYEASYNASIKTVNDLDDRLLTLYREANSAEVRQEVIGPTTAKKRLETVKRFVVWAWKHRHLEMMPRVLDKNYARVAKITTPEPKFFETEQVQKLFHNTTRRTQLYIALALNCSWNAVDIATLEHSMVDRQTRIVTRKRHETGVPTSYQLWPVTMDLLKAEQTTGGKLALLGANGNPLQHQDIKVDGTPKGRTCAIT